MSIATQRGAPTRLRAHVTWRGLAKLSGDGAAWAVGLTISVLLRYDFHVAPINGLSLVAVALGAAFLQMTLGGVLGLYTGGWRVGSLEEAREISTTVGAVTVVVFVADGLIVAHPVPPSSVVGGGLCTLVLIGGTRYVLRRLIDRLRRPSETRATRLIVFGAGEGGTQVIDAMLRDHDSPYIPVALLDDAPSKRHLRIRHVRVEGGRAEIQAVAAGHKAEALLIAIPSADRDTVADLTIQGRAAGLAVKVLPRVSALFGTGVDLFDIRDIREEDLLGRRKVDTDVAAIASYLTDRRVLVTGAGGSIGSELCRQIARFGPSELVMVDRDESALQEVQLSIEGRSLLDSPNLVLRRIGDRDGVFDLFRSRRPQVVFHAAANKHLPLLERYPGEAVENNVWGTLNVLEAAAEIGVHKFVNISTDKAADPLSVLGASKRVGERLTAHFAGQSAGIFLSVRFGNVLGSRGSVLTIFQAQVAAGGSLTVTHPDVTRYFMTIGEAVQLVIQAGAIGRRGEVLVLDMGHPVRIADVAARFAALSPRPVDIVYTGLRPGEKLHEVLLASDEKDERPFHDLISHVDVPPLVPALARALDARVSPERCRAALLDLCHSPDQAVADVRSSSELVSVTRSTSQVIADRPGPSVAAFARFSTKESQ